MVLSSIEMKLPTVALLSFAIVSSAFCQTVTKVDLAKDSGDKPGQVVTSFVVDDNPLHFLVHLKPLAEEATLSATLTAVHAGKHDNLKVATTSLASKKGTQSIDFRFRIHGPWPAGRYRIEIKDGVRLLKDLMFDIK